MGAEHFKTCPARGMKGLVLLVMAVVACAQPPLTSDSTQVPRLALPMPPTYAGRAPVYVPPVTDVYDVLVTNTRVLVVEVTVYSNEVQRTVWHKKGEAHPRTNFLILSSNMISRTTNAIGQ